MYLDLLKFQNFKTSILINLIFRQNLDTIFYNILQLKKCKEKFKKDPTT